MDERAHELEKWLDSEEEAKLRDLEEQANRSGNARLRFAQDL